MKRIISLSLITAFLCASSTPLIAQRGAEPREGKALRIKTSVAANKFASVNAYSDGNGAVVAWEMATETNNAGFYVYRLDGTESSLVSTEMILGSAATYGATPVPGEKYSFFDPNGRLGSVYYVQNFGLDGSTGTSASTSPEYTTDLSSFGVVSQAEQNREETKQRGTLISNQLRLPKVMAEEVADNAAVADAGTHAWVVAQPGVRIGIRRDGFYRVTKAELQAAGFNVNGDSSLWQLYREGVEQAIIVAANGDYVDFHGVAVDTPENDMAMYYLVSGPTAGKRIATKVARAVSGTVTSPNYAQTFVQKQRTNYLNQVLNGDAENYWGGVVSTGGNFTYNFNLTGVDFSSAQSTVELKFQGYSFDQHIVQVTLNGESLANATGTARSAFSKEYTVPTSFLREGANSLVMRAIGVSSDFSLFDTVSATYRRKQLATQNRLKFYTDNYRLSKLEGFASANVRVFDMTNQSSPVQWSNLSIVQEGPTYSVRMPSDRGRQMVAVEDSGLQTASSISANDPASLKATTNAARLIIIAHKNWMTQAQNWANYRIGQGVSVKVVDVSDIYDEFNYGDLSSLSIRDFLQYAKTNWQTTPNYVLLLGDASYDSRNYQGLGYNNFVPTHIVNTVFTETGSDDFLADFNGDGLADLAVGRVAARDAQTVTNVLAKVTNFESQAPTMFSRGILFASDCTDTANGYDFGQYSTDLKNQLPGGVPTTMIGRCDTPTPPDTPQSLLISSISTGKYLVNFSGHGTTGAWATTTFFSNTNVPQLTNANNQSIFTMLTCLNGYFLHASNKSLAENLVEATNGGAVASWASTGETTPDVQNVMAARFFNRLGSGNLERLGDLVNDAKAVIPGGTDVRLSWALIGDPMLKVRSASTGDRSEKIRFR